MNDDRVPESLMEAFHRNPDGTYRVRRLFAADALALVVSLLLPVALFALIFLVLAIISAIWGLPGEDALSGGVNA